MLLRSGTRTRQHGSTRPSTGLPCPCGTVRGEMGHRSTSMIENVYGHTIDQRTRAWNEQKLALPEVVEFRIEDHKDALEERLLALR